MAQIIVEPFAIAYGGAAPSLSINSGAGGANLLSLPPREIWSGDGATNPIIIQIDLGAVTSWDTIALVNCVAAAGATWTIRSGVAGYTETMHVNAGVMLLASEEVADATRPALFYSAASINARYVRIDINPAATAISMGCLVLGKSWQPTYPREQGAGRVPTDTGTRVEMPDGGIAGVPGVLNSGFDWVFADLDPADLKKLWGVFRRRRTTEPIILVEETTGAAAEDVHYCTFVNLERFERRDQSKSRWSLSVRDWR